MLEFNLPKFRFILIQTGMFRKRPQCACRSRILQGELAK
ncbi:hypothetical protein ACPOL_2238 [Acidisarcina polymorpha]|uniref:Uncharacterized protein n=1 Tax=Acidisarcina polymorpha TaxID=2211140 RepID=A0A2Z5FXP1_9BACT|nr:hypothetical protein ACPOL_2238 [Acidisarcina polymorpha]